MALRDTRRRVARDSVYDELRSAIVEWEFSPGERLSEESLAQRLGVSRTPVREALHRLEAEGLVVRSPAGFPLVADASRDDARSIFLVRTVLERVAARAASANATEEEFDAMDRILSAMAVAVEMGDIQLVTRYGRDFHGLIRQASGNRICISFLEQLQPHVDRYRVFTGFDQRRPREALRDHRAILMALRSRDAARCDELVARHLSSGEEVALAALEELAGGTDGVLPRPKGRGR